MLHRDLLQVNLTGPDGRTVRLLDDDGRSGADFRNYDVNLFDAAALSVSELLENQALSTALYSQDVRPVEPLRAFAGGNSAGTWTLSLCDTSGGSAAAAYVRSRLTLAPRLSAARSSTWLFRTSAIDKADYVTQTITFNGWDAAGNYAAGLSFEFFTDNVAPELTVAGHLDQITWGSPTTVISGTVSDGGPLTTVQIEVHEPGGAITLVNAARDGDNWWYQSPAATAGLYTLWVVATDAAGNRSIAGPYGLEVTCVPAAPTIASILVEPISGITDTLTITARLNNTTGGRCQQACWWASSPTMH